MTLILRKLWHDEVGAILAAEYMIIATLLVIGTIVGIKSLRDAVVCELADTAAAVSAFDNGHHQHSDDPNDPSHPDHPDHPHHQNHPHNFAPGTTVGEVIGQTN